MTCARREAGAHRLAASASSRSPSSRRTPPEGRSRPAAPGGRARLFLLLPVLALLLGALGLFAAAPAQAQSTTTVWTATLTVDASSDRRGCLPGRFPGDVCSTGLTDDEFTHGGTDYTIIGLWHETEVNLEILNFSGSALKTALSGLTLHLGTHTFAIDDASTTSSGVWWAKPSALSWSEGDTVTVKLTAPAATTKPAKPTGLSATAGNAQVALSWTDPSDSSITKYQYQQKAGTAAWGTWTNIPTSAPGEKNATSYTVTSLNNGTAYRFRIRAVNTAGNSPQSEIAGPVTPQADGASFTAAASGWFKPGDTVSVTYRITIASGDRNQALRAVIYRSANCSGNNPVAYSNTARNVATLTTAGQHTFTANLTVNSGVATASSNLCAWVGSSARWIARLPLTNFKVDATDPGISFPASPAVPRVGAASTITLSDAHSKIKKYGAIMVDGTSGAAADCNTAAKIGTGNLTTETTPLATKAFAYTVPSAASTVGKRVCAYAEDAAGNSNSALWGEAAQAAADNTAPTVSSAGYFSNAAATTPLTGPQKAGVDIYTKVTFSEDMNHVKSNMAAARPVLSYRIGSTDTQYDILNNADTLASGDCKPNHESNTNVYVCRYTVGSSVNGAFTVKVGTNSADKATNTLASVYTHSATLTLDTTKPAIAFPTAAPKVGVASTITLTDAGAKIKKYKVLEVPGATTAATACDDPSGDSFTPTSLTTAASPKTVSHTPSAGSTGKKLCVYAEDAAGNSNSKLWTTAIAAAPVVTGPTPQTVAADWACIPKDSSNNALVTAGQSFRLLFVTSTTTQATSTSISTYNDIVKTLAATNSCFTTAQANQFRAFISTSATSAKSNTATTGTGERIYWMKGAKVADNYADFFDNSWDSNAAKNESGSDQTGKAWTGTWFNGNTRPGRTAGSDNVSWVNPSSSGNLGVGNSPKTNSNRLLAFSPVLTVQATATKPAKPTGFTAAGHNSYVTLSWTNPSDSSITQYQYQQKEGSNAWGSWTNIPNNVLSENEPSHSYNVTSLTNGTVYQFRIRAVNAVGNGPQSDEVQATPSAPSSAPAKPTGITATAGNTQVVLLWTDPGDLSITKYQYRQKDGSNAWGSWTNIPASASGEANATGYTVTNLANGTVYRFRIVTG